MSILVLLLLASLVTACASPPANDAQRHDVGLLAGLDGDATQRPIDLALGIGTAVPVGDTPSARAFLDQGVAYLDAFEWVAAARSFHASLRLDPTLALAEIGLARAALGLETRSTAQQHARRARALAASTPSSNDRDAARLDFGLRQLAAVAAWDRGDPAPHLDLRARLDRHLDHHPGDVRLGLLRGHVDGRPDGWGQVATANALAWYRRALAVAPDHSGVQHALVHCLEGLGRHAEAVDHADRFAALAPAIPHAHHMRGHILPAVSRWADAEVALLQADRLHRARFRDGVLTPPEDWHFGHNLRLLAALHQRAGEHTLAEAAYREAAAIGYGGRRAGFYGLPIVLFLASHDRHDEALVAARACAALPSDLARVVCTAASGEALLALGDPKGARTALRDARRHHDHFQLTRRPDVSEATFGRMATVAVDLLDSKLARRAGNQDAIDARQRTIARSLCTGHSVDAWAMCQLRVGELAANARRLERTTLADQLAALIQPR